MKRIEKTKLKKQNNIKTIYLLKKNTNMGKLHMKIRKEIRKRKRIIIIKAT